MYIVGVNGSPNVNGNTFYLLDKTLEICEKKGANVEIVNVATALKECNQPFCVVCSNPCNKSCYEGTMLEEIYEKIGKADAVLFASPVYFGSMSAQLKAFFDKTRAVRGSKKWIGKIASAMSVGASKYGGQEATIKAIQDCMLVEGMTIVGEGSASFDAGHQGLAAQRPAENDESASKRFEVLATRLIETIQR